MEISNEQTVLYLNAKARARAESSPYAVRVLGDLHVHLAETRVIRRQERFVQLLSEAVSGRVVRVELGQIGEQPQYFLNAVAIGFPRRSIAS